jgi:hypothetical protein
MGTRQRWFVRTDQLWGAAAYRQRHAQLYDHHVWQSGELHLLYGLSGFGLHSGALWHQRRVGYTTSLSRHR